MKNKTHIEAPESVNHAFNELLNKMYISNVRNRLRQLNEPTENDCKRWVWELIQNAKDSISQDENRLTVDVKIEVKEDKLIFKHNGSPFTAKAQLGLLYKYSEGKVNNSESTGRFGTGFLTTHTLSKIVSIEGDVYKNDDRELCGFSATMYRDGIDELELLEGVEKMRESMIYTKELNDWTTYTYYLKTLQNKKALTLGLNDFIQNIAQVMLFCEELNTVVLDNKGVITRITRNEQQELSNNIFISEVRINDSIKRFVHKYIEEQSEELTERFKKDRNLRLTAAVEFDEEYNIVENETSPSHFCVLPLVGSEKHIMPIYLNSPDFEPDSERESLILIGEDMLSDKQIISEGGINRLILKKSIELYDSLVSYLSTSGYQKLYLLAKGLKRGPDFEKSFNKDWFEKEMILPYREVLKKYDIVETDSGNQKLFNTDNTANIIIPTGNKEVRQEIYSLACELFPSNLPAEKYASNWAFFAWSDCGLLGIDNLCEYVSEKENASNLPSYEWLNKFLAFIKEEDEKLLKKYALVPNCNGDFVSLEVEDFAEGVGLTNFVLDILLSLDLDLRPKLLNSQITTISLPIKVNAESIADKIDKQSDLVIKDKDNSDEKILTKLLPLLNIIPNNTTTHSQEFITKQTMIHSLAAQLFSTIDIRQCHNNDIPAKAWNALHKWLQIKLIKATAEYKCIESLPSKIENKVQWLNDFLAFVVKEDKVSKLDEDNYGIIPNQNGVFCLKKNLHQDKSIPDELKSELAESFGIRLRETLLHKDINSIQITQEKDLNTVIQIIKCIFENDIIEEGNKKKDKLDFAIYLLHFLPEHSSPTMYNSQYILLEIVRKYYYDRSKKYERPISISCNSEDFWSRANAYIVSMLQKHIEDNSSIIGLKAFLSESGDENFVNDHDNGCTIILLNDFYIYLKQANIVMSYKIFPNQNGDFCGLQNLFNDGNISNELMDVLSLVKPEQDFRKILADKSLSIQPKISKTEKDIAEVIDEVIKTKFKNRENWEGDEEFKKAIELLTEFFRKNKNPNDIFGYCWNQKDSIELNVLWSEEDKEILQAYRNGDLGIEQVKQKDNEIAHLKEENAKLKTKNEDLEKLLMEKAEIEREKMSLQVRLGELLNSEPNSSEIENIEGEIRIMNDEIAAINDTTIAISYDDDISLNDQKEVNREAKEVVKERLEKEGFLFTKGIEGYSIIDGVMRDGIEFPLVVKSYKYQDAPLKIGANEWIQLMKPNSMFWVHFGNRKTGCLNLYELLRKQDKLNLSFSTENIDFENRLENFAEILQYFKNVHFDFNSIKSNNYSTAENLKDYRFSERRIEEDLSSDHESLL